MNTRTTAMLLAGLGLASNASAIIVTLDDFSEEETFISARAGVANLGSDVVFATGALLGHAHCLVSGTGEVLDPLPPRPPLWLVLIFPDVTCPTGPVYRAFDALNHSEHPPVGPDLQRCRHAANAALTANAANAANAALTHPEALFNDLTEPAFTVRPALRKAHTNAQVAANQPIHMSGSGSALFTLASNEPAAHALAGRIRQQTNLPTRVTCSR